MRRIIVLMMVAVAVVAISVLPVQAQFNFFKNPMIGKAAQDFVLPSTDGKTYSLTQLRGGRAAIVFFWATWCPHCRHQISELSKKADDLENKEISVVLVDLGEEEERVAAYLKQNNIMFPVLLDQTTEVASDYKILGVPTFYYISADGTVQSVEYELVSNYEKVLLEK